MPSIQFRLESPSQSDIDAHVRAEYGPDARITSTEEVRVGGVGGFFARRYVDVVVDVPAQAPHQDRADAHPVTQPVATSAPTGATAFQLQFEQQLQRMPVAQATAPVPAAAVPAAAVAAAPAAPVGIAALLDQADEFEARFAPTTTPMTTPVPVSPRYPVTGSAIPPVSTETEAFAHVFDELRSYVATSGSAGAATKRPTKRAPAIMTDAGDLVVIVGLGDDALVVATSLAKRIGTADVCVGGDIVVSGNPRVDERRGAMAARARGVESGRVTIVAFGLGEGGPTLAMRSAVVASLGSDQAWLAVDASRKEADTAQWVQTVRKTVQAQAIAVLRSAWTSTPDSVRALGLPEGWSDAVL